MNLNTRRILLTLPEGLTLRVPCDLTCEGAVIGTLTSYDPETGEGRGNISAELTFGQMHRIKIEAMEVNMVVLESKRTTPTPVTLETDLSSHIAKTMTEGFEEDNRKRNEALRRAELLETHHDTLKEIEERLNKEAAAAAQSKPKASTEQIGDKVMSLIVFGSCLGSLIGTLICHYLLKP